MVTGSEDNLEAIIESAEMDTYGRLEELEAAPVSATTTMDLAIVHTEIACLPITPKVSELVPSSFCARFFRF